MSESTEFTFDRYHKSLAEIGSRLRKNKRNATKYIPQAIEDLQHLIDSSRLQTMQSESAASRAAEAQLLMSLAVTHKAAGQLHSEAQCYLGAAALWFAMERERLLLNLPTTDDCLARGVLCSAMACEALLSIPTPLSASPVPLAERVAAAHPTGLNASIAPAGFRGSFASAVRSLGGTSPPPAPPPLPSMHIAKVWAICLQVSCVLYEFACFEMAADYAELAASIVSCRSAFAAVGAAPDASRPGQSSFCGSDGGEVNATSPAVSSPAADREPSKAADSSSPTPPRLDRRSVRLQQAPSLAEAMTDRVAPTMGNTRSADVLLQNGMMLHYMTAMHKGIMSCCLVKDYARAVSLTEEVQKVLRMFVSSCESAVTPISVGATTTSTAVRTDAKVPQPPTEAAELISVDLTAPQTSTLVSEVEERAHDPDSIHSPTAVASHAASFSMQGAHNVRRTVDTTTTSLLELETVIVQICIAKFLTLLLRKEASAVIREALQEIRRVTMLVNRSAEAYVRCLMLSADSDGSTEPQAGHSAGSIVSALRFSSSLDTLCETLEILLDAYEAYRSSNDSEGWELVLSQSAVDFRRLLSDIGQSSRELTILCCRVVASITHNPYLRHTLSQEEERSDGLNASKLATPS